MQSGEALWTLTEPAKDVEDQVRKKTAWSRRVISAAKDVPANSDNSPSMNHSGGVFGKVEALTDFAPATSVFHQGADPLFTL